VDWDTIYPQLTGTDHKNKHTTKSGGSYSELDDIEYAGHFAKAFAHAVELCGIDLHGAGLGDDMRVLTSIAVINLCR
jgi:hypothetical protein